MSVKMARGGAEEEEGTGVVGEVRGWLRGLSEREAGRGWHWRQDLTRVLTEFFITGHQK